MNEKRYLLAADGGGSKTAVVLTDLQLQVKHLKLYPRSNPGDIGYPNTQSLLLNAFAEVCAEANIDASEIAAVFAGIAGLSAGTCAPSLRAALAQAYPSAAVDASHDGINVLYASFPDGGDGVAVICGTGSSCFIMHDGVLYRVGGCGQFDLRGNGFEIGRSAFAHVFRAMDGREEGGWLEAALNARFDGSCHEHIIEINGFSKNQFASYAPLVFEAAREHGDAAALAILHTHLSYVAEMIRSAGRILADENGNIPPYTVGLAGGIFRDELTLPILREYLPATITLHLPTAEPYLGAAARAKAQAAGAPLLQTAACVRLNPPMSL